ncbi:MAG: hypothetical protein K0S56_3053 [Microvirga sp.]|jgi:hypothetical protein|nr:hypothetical protein [Microvirga sp.]
MSTLRCRILPRVPTRVIPGAGIAASVSNGNLNIALDYRQIAVEPIAEYSDWLIAVQDPDDGSFISAPLTGFLQGQLGYMYAGTYDPQEIEADAFDRSNHTGTQDFSTITDWAASQPEAEAGTINTKAITPLRLLDRLKWDGYLSIRHFGVKLNGTDESTAIDAALANGVVLKFPAIGAPIPIYEPLVVRQGGGIIGDGEFTILQRRFNGGAVVSFPGGAPITLRDFQISKHGSVAIMGADDGVRLGFDQPWAQRGSVKGLLISGQWNGFTWQRGTEGPMEDIHCYYNYNNGFLGSNPRGTLVRCLAQFNGLSLTDTSEFGNGYLMYYTVGGETGVVLVNCGSFGNFGYGHYIAGSVAGANVWGEGGGSSFDRRGGIRVENAFTQFRWRGAFIEYAGRAGDFQPDFTNKADAVGLFVNSAVTMSDLEGLQVLHNNGHGAIIGGSDISLRNSRFYMNGQSGTGNGLWLFNSARDLDITDITIKSSGTTDLVVDSGVTGMMADISAGTLSVANNPGMKASNVGAPGNGIVNVGSASSVALPGYGSAFYVTGTTNINTIPASWPGREITLFFVGSLTVSDGGGNLRLNGNLVATGGSTTLSLICVGADWYETRRTVS